MKRRDFLLSLAAIGCSDQLIKSSMTTPTDVSGLIYWIDSDHTTNTGDGTDVTSATDLSGSGNITSAAGAFALPKFRATRWNYNQTAIDFLNQALKVIGPVTAMGVVGQPYTIIAVLQPRHNNVDYLCAFSDNTSTAFSRQRGHRYETDSYKWGLQGNTSTGNPPIVANSDQWLPNPCCFSYRTDGTQDFYGDDGIRTGPFANTWTGVLASNQLTLGGVHYNDGSGFAVSNMLLRAFLVYNRKLSDSELAAVEFYCGITYGLQQKAIYGAKGNTLVFKMDGQSNMMGADLCGDGKTYSVTNPNAFMLGMDGLYKPLNEPSHDPTNRVDPFGLYINPDYGASFAGSMANRLWSRGVRCNLLFVPCAEQGSASEAWTTSIGGPPIFNSVGPMGIYRTLDALRLPNPKLTVLVDQGESNGDSAAHAAAWENDWRTILNRYVTFFGTGTFTQSTARFVVSRLSLNITGVAFASNLRAAEDALRASRTDMLLPQRGDATICLGSTLHQRLADFRDVYGPLMADTCIEAGILCPSTPGPTPGPQGRIRSNLFTRFTHRTKKASRSSVAAYNALALRNFRKR